jgi:subtilisin family serine protease
VSVGRLDPRLFDVSGLVRAGYDDSRRADLPLIVDYPGATPRAAGPVRELPSVSAVALRARKGTSFWAGARSAAKRVWLDAPVTASLDRSVAQIGAPRAWASGHTGAGVTVAVLDTGIDVTHPDLDDAVVGAQDFTGSESGTDDRHGHGTHVASIITGSGERYQGVAPAAEILNGKVLDDDGGGFESGIIAGMEWAAAGGADVVNMSLGNELPSDGTDPMSQAVNRLTADTGTLFVVAAGNTGPEASTVGSPGAADAALTVGSVDRREQLDQRSGRGPRQRDGAVKPDVTSPGVGIVAAKAAHGRIGEPAGDGYVSLSGTSMAAPHVAGAAAILAGQHPEWTPTALKSVLTSTSVPNPELSVFEQGAGRVDVAATTAAPVLAAPASLSLGTASWPHHDDERITSTITYTNTASAPVTLRLTADLRAPAGMFTLSADEVTVPVGGRTEVTLHTDTSAGAADGTFGGAIVATGGGNTLRTPVAVTREVESYDVTFTAVDRDGKPTPNYLFRLIDLHSRTEYAPYDESGTAVVRVPRGDYHLMGYIVTGTGGTDIVEPAITVSGTAEYVFDARDGVRPGITVDEPDAEAADARISAKMTADWGEVGYDIYLPSLDEAMVRPSRTRAAGRFTFVLETALAKPGGSGQDFHASPFSYHLRKRYTSGDVPANLTSHMSDEQLTKVISEHAVGPPDQIGIRDGFLTMPLPHTLTEYYTPNEEWYPYFAEASSTDTSVWSGYSDTATPVVYELGETVRERWNVGVFGPSLPPDPDVPGTHVFRQGDVISLSLAMYGDQSPHREGLWESATASLSLHRGDELIGESPGAWGEFTVPPDVSTYTVRVVSDRDGPLSTRISSTWTFPSGHTETGARTPIPLLAVRFAPNLDDHNAAEAGQRFRLPVYVQRNGSTGMARVNQPEVEVSYDDGATWSRARVRPQRDRWIAEVDHPADAEFVSLRTSVSDQNGVSAEQTIIHAYRLRN